MKLRVALLLLLAVPLYAGKTRSVRHMPAAPDVPPGTPTFSNEVVRIFQDNCQSCHHEGDIAPFALVNYADAKARAPLIRFMTETRQMPPWKPVEGCGDFANERRLSDADIATIAKWVEAGAPEGDRAQLPEPLDFSAGWENGPPDLVLKNATAYTPPSHTDTYRCFTIPTNLVSSAYVAAVDTHPGDRETVHHVLTFIDTTGESLALDEADPGPGYTCFGGPGFAMTGTLGGWAPGSRALEMPSDVAFELPPNSRVVMQVHYHPHHGDPEPDQTELGLYLAKEPPAKLMQVIPIINQSFTIPPNDANYQVDAVWPILTPVKLKIWFVAPHMHLLGKKMTVEMKAPNKDAQCLITINDWNFNWQGAYAFETPIDVPIGTRMSLRAHYDNSSSNPLNPNDPPKAVSWGEATTDEMCIAFLGVTIE
ncbi:MAG TPA: ascorbate-dependent monooxygenase [Thermoanaerobaculia bacterium]